MRKINFYAKEPHYFDHLIPVYLGLSEEVRGEFHVSDCVLKERELAREHCKSGLFGADDLVLVCGYADYRDNTGDIIYIEHGVGHSYGNGNAGYAGGSGRERVVLFLNVNQRVHDMNMSAYPNTPQYIVGSPKMDLLHTYSEYNHKKPLVCVSFHWDCKVAPETMSAFPYYRVLFKHFPKSEKFDLCFHSHPRIQQYVSVYAQRWGFEFIPDFADVIKRADIYIVDNSSTLYEFASTNKPVIVMNCPLYRKHIHHGLRFWEDIPAIQVDHAKEFLPALYRTIEKPYEFSELRKEITSRVYPYLGQSVERCCKILEEFSKNQ